MTAGLAIRRLREVGGVSRDRLLVDKMIVWRTILGLIMASKWPAPESQSACHFSNDRRQGLVINASKFREARSYAKNPSPPISYIGRCRWPPPAILRPSKRIPASGSRRPRMQRLDYRQ